MHIYIYIHIYIHLSIYLSLSLSLYIYIYTFVYTHLCCLHIIYAHITYIYSLLLRWVLHHTGTPFRSFWGAELLFIIVVDISCYLFVCMFLYSDV